MSDFNFVPSITSNLSKEPRINSLSFGDSYELRIADGINNNPQKWRLIFNNQSNTDADTIEAFLDLRGGVTKFTWTPPGKSEIKVICKFWDRNYNFGLLNTFTM